MSDLAITLMQTLDLSREEAQLLASMIFNPEDEDQWADEYETF